MAARYNTNLSAGILRKLEQIAMNASYTLKKRGSIALHHNDSDDFPEIDITSIQEMLEEAYRLGHADGEKVGRMEANA